jgi:hypothetical protein
LAALTPRLVRNAVASGNPVFPALTGLFGTGHWTIEQVERFRAGHLFDGGVARRLGLLLIPDASDPMGPTHRGLAHPQWFLFFAIAIPSAIGVVLMRRTRGAGRVWSLALGLQLVMWLIATHVQSRFLIPLALPGVVVAALAASAAPAAWGARTIGVLAMVQALALGAVQLGEREGRASVMLPVGPAEFTGQEYWHLFLTGSAARRAEYLDRASPEVFASFGLPTPCRLLLVGGATPLYFSLPRSCVPLRASPGDGRGCSWTGGSLMCS